MSDVSIRAALENHLNGMTPALATAWQNKDFVPAAGVPYQRVELVRATPENPTFDSFVRLSGFMQITLMYPPNVGPGVAEARAELVKIRFARRTNLIKDTVVVTISGTPYIMAGFQDGDRWAIPVRVPYYANIT